MRYGTARYNTVPNFTCWTYLRLLEKQPTRYLESAAKSNAINHSLRTVRVWGLGLRGSGFRVQGLGFRVYTRNSLDTVCFRKAYDRTFLVLTWAHGSTSHGSTSLVRTRACGGTNAGPCAAPPPPSFPAWRPWRGLNLENCSVSVCLCANTVVHVWGNAALIWECLIEFGATASDFGGECLNLGDLGLNWGTGGARRTETRRTLQSTSRTCWCTRK
eukprot:3268597-Rhodomonas_salina.2